MRDILIPLLVFAVTYSAIGYFAKRSPSGAAHPFIRISYDI